MNTHPIKFGLIGKRLDYSFSKNYFNNKFTAEHLQNHTYQNIELPNDEALKTFCKNEAFNFKGLNVTIPYKELILSYLDSIDSDAQKIGAVNTIFIKDTKLIGYNTDFMGFKEAIIPYLKKHHTGALILGTGGASKAIEYALKQLDIESKLVSRTPKHSNHLNYKQIDEKILFKYNIIINTTPLGTFPNVEDVVELPFLLLNEKNLIFDLIYNPSETKLLQHSKLQGATTVNGLNMLQLQAEYAWKIWNVL
jgi:shikimate dehydrogenase